MHPVPQTNPSNERAPRGHLLALDGVRGLAILMVVCSHAFQSNYPFASFPIRIIGQLLFYGALGVDLFFVLSGFLITGILVDSLNDRSYFLKFYARRALRIFPLYYGVLFICFALTHPLHLHWGSMGWLLLFYLQNLHPREIVIFHAGPGVPLFHFWSLAIEEQFYLVWPAIVYLVRNQRNLLRVMLILSAGSLILRLGLITAAASGFTTHVSTICRADSLLLGGALAVLYRSRGWRRVTTMAPAGFLLAVTIILSCTLWLDPDPLASVGFRSQIWLQGFRYSIVAIGFTCLIAWSLQQGSSFQRLFQQPWLRFLGKYSYGIYVIHIFVFASLIPLLRSVILRYTHSKLLAVALAGVASISVSVALALVSFHFYESRFLRWKHHFDYDRESMNHSAPAGLHRTAISSR